MKNILLSTSLLIMIFSANFVQAGEVVAEGSLNKLLELSGLTKQVSDFPGMVKALDIKADIAKAGQQRLSISDAEIVDMKSSIADAFQPSEILSVIRAEVKNNISETDAKYFLAWYESRLGLRITKAEEDASTPAAYQEMNGVASSLLSDAKRVEFAKKLDRLLNASDMMTQLQEEAAVATFIAVSEAMHPSQPVNIGAFKAQLSAQLPQRKANIEQLVIVSLVYSYRDIDMVSLKKYATFLERPNTKRFNESVMKGFKIALDQSIDKMAKSLALLSKTRTTSGSGLVK